jgi:cullin 3
MDRSEAAAVWDVLAGAIDEIYNRNASQLSFEELYRNAYNLVLHKHGALLYEGVTAKLSSHLAATVEKLAATSSSTTTSSSSAFTSASSSSTTDVRLLEEMARAWREHTITMIMIRDILMYMDRTYVTQQKRRPVYELGFLMFVV